MNAAQLLGALIPPWRASLPPSVPLPYFDGFIRRNRWALEDKLGVLLAHVARAQAPRAAAPDLEDPPGEFTAADLRVLLGYSGHGGLSIEKVRDQYPPELVPETFGLIHEYYTPTALAQAIGDAVGPRLPSLVGRDGFIRALEPSAGIGRLVRSLSAPRCLALQAGGQIKGVQWTTVGFSKVSSRMLRTTRPDTQHFEMPFERWIHQEGARHRGTINLILSNPPYGERGAMALEDPEDAEDAEDAEAAEDAEDAEAAEAARVACVTGSIPDPPAAQPEPATPPAPSTPAPVDDPRVDPAMDAAIMGSFDAILKQHITGAGA
jgi:hypothetical protein